MLPIQKLCSLGLIPNHLGWIEGRFGEREGRKVGYRLLKISIVSSILEAEKKKRTTE